MSCFRNRENSANSKNTVSVPKLYVCCQRIGCTSLVCYYFYSSSLFVFHAAVFVPPEAQFEDSRILSPEQHQVAATRHRQEIQDERRSRIVARDEEALRVSLDQLREVRTSFITSKESQN